MLTVDPDKIQKYILFNLSKNALEFQIKHNFGFCIVLVWFVILFNEIEVIDYRVGFVHMNKIGGFPMEN